MTVSPADTPDSACAPTSPIRVVVVDDDQLAIKALRSYLDASPEVEVLTSFTSATDALAFLRRVRADVVLTDVNMPGTDGIALLSNIKKATPDTAVVILTSLDDDMTMMDALRMEANGFLLKSSKPSEIIDAILAAHKGGTLISPEAAARLVRDYLKPALPKTPSNVTETEQAVLDCLCSGMSNREIANHLIISESTVKVHVSHLMRKFDVSTRLKLVVAATKVRSSS